MVVEKSFCIRVRNPELWEERNPKRGLKYDSQNGNCNSLASFKPNEMKEKQGVIFLNSKSIERMVKREGEMTLRLKEKRG